MSTNKMIGTISNIIKDDALYSYLEIIKKIEIRKDIDRSAINMKK